MYARFFDELGFEILWNTPFLSSIVNGLLLSSILCGGEFYDKSECFRNERKDCSIKYLKPSLTTPYSSSLLTSLRITGTRPLSVATVCIALESA